MKQFTPKLLNLPEQYQLTDHYEDRYRLKFSLKIRGKSRLCPKCGTKTNKVYERKFKKIKHTFWHHRPCWLFIETRKFRCPCCKSRFWEELPGIAKYARRSEALKEQISEEALNGYNNKAVAKKYNIGTATVQRDINSHARRKLKEKESNICPRILGIDEHFFTKKSEYITTLCDLERRKVFDIVQGRSERSLATYLRKLENKERCEVIVMDLSSTYRSIAKKYFPNAKIVADRFHVVRLALQRVIETWKQLAPKDRANRGLVSLFRRHPSKLSVQQENNFFRYLNTKPHIKALYKLKNRLGRLLNLKEMKHSYARKVIRYYFSVLHFLRKSNFQPLIKLADTLEEWHEEILMMMRINRSNGPTEGFHNKMKRIVRIGYGFRNFENYRLRVLLQCG